MGADLREDGSLRGTLPPSRSVWDWRRSGHPIRGPGRFRLRNQREVDDRRQWRAGDAISLQSVDHAAHRATRSDLRRNHFGVPVQILGAAADCLRARSVLLLSHCLLRIMKTFPLYLKLVAFGFAFHLAAPAFAQSSFQGMDPSETKKKRKKSSGSKKKRSKKAPAQTKPAAPSSNTAATTAASAPVPSVTKVSEPVKPVIPMPPPPPPKPPPTLTFQAADVSST